MIDVLLVLQTTIVFERQYDSISRYSIVKHNRKAKAQIVCTMSLETELKLKMVYLNKPGTFAALSRK